MGVWDHVWLGVRAVFEGPALFQLLGLPVPVAIVMTLLGLLVGIVVGATPGLAGPMAMAVSLPILISIFGVTPEALLPVFGFLIGIMKGATVGGAVPAILFNTPGTPDALLTTLDGHPMAKNGQPRKALRIAHLSSVTGDTFSDIVLFVCAPFLAVVVERYLDLPEKTAIIILSLAFIAAVISGSVWKGLISASLGMLIAFVATGEDYYPRLTLGMPELASGFPMTTAVVGVLMIGEMFRSIEDMWHEHRTARAIEQLKDNGDHHIGMKDVRTLAPFVGVSAVIGTVIGALPGIGSTMAATLGYEAGKRMHQRRNPDGRRFGEGAPEGIAATEAANSAVSGANLIPVLSLGIPGNAAAVFLILAAESIGGFNPGPSVFKVPSTGTNPEMVIAFGMFTLMVVGNVLNWTIGGYVMRATGIMIRVPKQILMPIVLLVTLTAIYVQEGKFAAVWFALGFGVLGYLLRRLRISVLPFVITFILARDLESTARQAFSATGGDPFFLFTSPLALAFMIAAVAVVVVLARSRPSTQTGA